jgi:hypothetical protein
MKTSADEIEHWARWALAEADRIDPLRNGRFLETPDHSFCPVGSEDGFGFHPSESDSDE